MCSLEPLDLRVNELEDSLEALIEDLMNFFSV
jgi:hypothetical protein